MASDTGQSTETGAASGDRTLPEQVDDATIARLVEQVETGETLARLRRRGRPPLAGSASKVYSIRLPEGLITSADARAAVEGITRSELVRRALIDYLLTEPESDQP